MSNTVCFRGREHITTCSVFGYLKSPLATNDPFSIEEDLRPEASPYPQRGPVYADNYRNRRILVRATNACKPPADDPGPPRRSSSHSPKSWRSRLQRWPQTGRRKSTSPLEIQIQRPSQSPH